MNKNTKTTAAKTTKKTETTVENNLDKIAGIAKNINAEVKEVANELVDDMLTSTKEVRAVAAKSVKEVAEKVDFTDSVAKIKETAKSVNKQIKETATDVIDDVKENGKELRSAANKLAKEAVNNVKLNDRLKNVKKFAANTNAFALETAEELVDSITVTGEKWQNLTEKAMKNGLKLAAKQQDIMFNTLEAMKGQVGGGAKRFKKLFN
jgi:glutamate-1-semialdehyde aminotransferase